MSDPVKVTVSDPGESWKQWTLEFGHFINERDD